MLLAESDVSDPQMKVLKAGAHDEKVIQRWLEDFSFKARLLEGICVGTLGP